MFICGYVCKYISIACVYAVYVYVVSIRICIYTLALRIRGVCPFYETVTAEATVAVCAVYVCMCVSARVNCLDLSRRVKSSRSSCRRAARKFTVHNFFVCLFGRMAKRAGCGLLLLLFLFGLLFLLCFYFSFATSLPLPHPLSCCRSFSLFLNHLSAVVFHFGFTFCFCVVRCCCCCRLSATATPATLLLLLLLLLSALPLPHVILEIEIKSNNAVNWAFQFRFSRLRLK